MFTIIGTVTHCPGSLTLSVPLIGSQIASIRFCGCSIWMVGFAEAGERAERKRTDRERKGGGRRMVRGVGGREERERERENGCC